MKLQFDDNMMDTIIETIDFARKRSNNGWNARDETLRNFELAAANRLLEDLSIAIKCEISRQEEINCKVSKLQKELKA